MKNNKFKYVLHDIVWGVGSFFGYIWFRPKNRYISETAKRKIKGGALLVSNHTGFFDPVYLMMSLNYRRHHFVATKEFFNNKFKKFLFEKVFLCIMIDRENVGMETIRAITKSLKNGELVSMFPEGKISENASLSTFKSGAVFMALKSGCPIIPVYIRKRKNIFRRQVTVFGEPIYVSLKNTDLPAMEYVEKTTETLRKKELELENYYNKIVRN